MIKGDTHIGLIGLICSIEMGRTCMAHIPLEVERGIVIVAGERNNLQEVAKQFKPEPIPFVITALPDMNHTFLLDKGIMNERKRQKEQNNYRSRYHSKTKFGR